MEGLLKCLTITNKMSTLTDTFNEKLGTFEFDPEIVHHFSDGLYTKQFRIPKALWLVNISTYIRICLFWQKVV